MKERNYSGARSNAYLATSIATLFAALSVDIATAQSDTTQVEIATCQALSDSSDLDKDSIETRLACYSRDVEHLNQLVNQLTQERDQLLESSSSPDKDATIESYKQELSQRQSSIQRLEERAAELSAQIDEITADRNQMRDQLQSLLSEDNNLAVESEANEKLFASFSLSYLKLTEELEALRAKLSEFESQNTKLADLQLASEKQNLELTTQIEALEQTVADLNAEKVQLEANVADSSAELENIKQQLLDNSTLAEQRLAQIEELKEALNQSEQARADLETEISSLKEAHLAEMTNLSKQTTDLNDEILALKIQEQDLVKMSKNESEALNTELARIASARQALNGQRLQLLGKISTLEATHLEQTQNYKQQVASLEDQVAKITTEKTDLSEQLQAQKSNNEKLKEFASKSTKKSAEFNLLAEDLGKKLTAAETVNAELQSNIDSLNAESAEQKAEYTQKLTDLNTTIDANKAERDALASELDIVQPKLKAAEENLIASNNKNEALSTDVKKLEQQLANATEKQQTLQASLQAAEEQSEQTSAKLATLKKDSTTVKTLLDLSRAHSKNADATLAELRSEMQASNDRLAAKQKELEELVAEKNRIESESKAVASQANAQANTIKNALVEAGHENVDIQVGEDNIISVLLGSGQLFNTGSSRLSDAGTKVLADLAGTFESLDNRRIMINGHSDNVPLGPNLREIYKDNWGLSMARALATANFLSDEADIAADKMTVSGFGATQPIADNDTEDGRQQNRRVEIRLTPLDEQIASAK